MFRFALLVLACLSNTACACSFAQVGAFTFTNALHAADVVVIARVGKDITPEPAPTTVDSDNLVTLSVSPFNDRPTYHMGTFKEVLSGDYSEGKIIFKSGIFCGPGELQEKTSYLLFGSVFMEEVPGELSVS